MRGNTYDGGSAKPAPVSRICEAHEGCDSSRPRRRELAPTKSHRQPEQAWFDSTTAATGGKEERRTGGAAGGVALGSLRAARQRTHYGSEPTSR
jgi:hypothetical protein